MYKYFSILFLATLFGISGAKAEISRDSIGIENLKGKKVIIHRIVAHDTYYSVARRYNVSPKDIMSFNDNKYLQIGVVIKVPTQVDFNESQTGKATVSSQSPTAATTNTQEIEYTVKAKDNLNRIAMTYGTTVKEIKALNNLTSINLHIGQLLKIPAKADVEPAAADTTPVDTSPIFPASNKANQAKTVPPTQTAVQTVQPPVQTKPVNTGSAMNKGASPAAKDSTSEEEFIEHTVASNETIYSIATTYHMTMDQLKAKNNLTTNSLRVGQKLIIKGQYPRIPRQAAVEPLTSGDTTLKNPSLRGAPSRYGLNQVDEKGTGVWITDPDLDPVKMLVLHRSAPIGTIIKVTNPMTNRSTFAKVVGKFTENESTKDVIIVMTKAVAESIGALDKRFFCNLTYSGQEIEQ
jgi:LysM repeat protein